MLPIQEFFSVKRLDFILVASAITSVQKFVFVLYIAASLWNGSFYEICNRILMPQKPDIKWLSFFQNDAEDCDSTFQLFTKQRCIKSLLLKDDSGVYTAALDLSKFSKWHYLLIIRTFKLLAPFTIQMNFLLFPFLAVTVTTVLVKRILVYLGYENLWLRAGYSLRRLSSRTGLERSNFKSFLCLVFGFLATSLIFCLCTASPESECTTSTCLYCYPRLMHTLFKEQITDPYFNDRKSIQFLFGLTKYFTTALFSSFLYASTVVFLCMILYIVIDACVSLYDTGRNVARYLSTVSFRKTFTETWRQYLNPLSDFLPFSNDRQQSNVRTPRSLL
ncbi:hypothetical protein TNCT_636931 [Trichonephila clavata]|uniref:Uncharacterized protein n=1 Tax=Trichonephila clavata TaxID=2740835 RepID=A0A8X6J523_TRICU|nr:hypothetical protein TNCT_636931 [Trichonephila clavata]